MPPSSIFPLSRPPRTLAIMRLSAIGDVTHMLPVVNTLQKVWPQTQITWFIGKLEAQLIGDFPNVEFIIVDKGAGWKGYWQLYRRMRHRQFDIFLQMQVSLRASITSMMIPAKVRIGFDRKRAADKQWWFTDYQIPHQPRQHVLDSFFEFLVFLGINERHLQWSLPIPPVAYEFAKNTFPSNKKLLVINPCSSQRRNNWRNWRHEHYAAVIEYAVTHCDMHVALTGGPAANEVAMGEAVLAALSPVTAQSVTDLIGKTALKELAAILDKACAVIAPDTGPAHIANAVGTPVIGLYATSNPERTGPYDRRWVVNQYPAALAHIGLSEASAKWGQRVRDPNVLDLITVAQVTDKLSAVLAESKQ